MQFLWKLIFCHRDASHIQRYHADRIYFAPERVGALRSIDPYQWRVTNRGIPDNYYIYVYFMPGH